MRYLTPREKFSPRHGDAFGFSPLSLGE